MMLLNPFWHVPSGGAFSPASVAGLRLWLDASQIAGKSDGDLIDQWDDASGNGYHVTAAGALRPTYKVNIENGKPAVLFSGAQYLTGTQRQNLIASNNYAIFVAAKVADLSLAAAQYFVSDLGSRLIVYSDTSGNLQARHTDSVGAFDRNAGAGTNGVAYVFDVRHDEGYGGADTRRHEVKRSGGTSTGNFGIGALTATGATDAMYFGGRSGVSRFVTGHVFEYIIYNSSVSDADRTSIRNYLATKYGFVYS
jgi:hypothetical protein